MEKLLKKINLNNIYLIIVCLNILLLNIFVGSTHQRPKILLETVIIIEGLIYIIISKITRKDKIIIKGKIDIFVIIMVIITSIPLILKTYCSLSCTIDIFIQYLTIYSMYIIVRNVVNNEIKKSIFINSILLSSVFMLIFGIDRLNFNVLKPFYDIIDSLQVKDNRMTALMGYWNALFAYIIPLIFIAFGKYLEITNKKIAGLYVVYIQLAMYAFYYCNSRAGMIIFILIFILYIIRIKDAKKVISVVLITVFTYVVTFIFAQLNYLFENQITLELCILATLLFSYFLGIAQKQIILKIKVKNVKKNVAVLIIVLISCISVYFLVAKRYSKPMKIKPEYENIMLYDLKANSNYNIKLDLSLEQDEKVNIKIYQIDSKRKTEEIYNNTFVSYNKNLLAECSITTSQIILDKVSITIQTSNNDIITLNNIYINGKESIVNYKYLPNNIMRLAKTVKLSNVSITERLSMYKSGIKLFEQHPIVGNGAKTFENLFQKVREYDYSVMEVHSFLIDILMDYGIIGIITIFIILIITICNFVNRKDKNIIDISVFIGWIFIIIHSMIDFDLAYLVTLTNFFMLIAIINEKDINLNINTKWIEDIVIIIMTFVILLNIYRLPGEILYKNEKYANALIYMPYSRENTYNYIMQTKEKSYFFTSDNIDILIYYLNNEKNQNQFRIISLLYNTSIKLIKNNEINSGIKGLEQIVKMIKNDEIIIKYDVVEKENWKVFLRKIKYETSILNKEIQNKELGKIIEELKDID